MRPWSAVAVLVVACGRIAALPRTAPPEGPCDRVDAYGWLRGHWCTAADERECVTWWGPGELHGPGCGPHGEGEFCDEMLGATRVTNGAMDGEYTQLDPCADRPDRRGDRACRAFDVWPLAIDATRAPARHTLGYWNRVNAMTLRAARCDAAEIMFEGPTVFGPAIVTWRRTDAEMLVWSVEFLATDHRADGRQWTLVRRP